MLYCNDHPSGSLSWMTWGMSPLRTSVTPFINGRVTLLASCCHALNMLQVISFSLNHPITQAILLLLLPILLMKTPKFKELKQFAKVTSQSLERLHVNQVCLTLVSHTLSWGSRILAALKGVPLFCIPIWLLIEKSGPYYTSGSSHSSSHQLDRPGYLWKWCLLFPTSHTPGEHPSHSKMSTFKLLQAFSKTPFSRTQWSVSPSSCCKGFCK